MELESALRTIFIVLLVLTTLSFVWYLSFYLPSDPVLDALVGKNETLRTNDTMILTNDTEPMTPTPTPETPTEPVDPRKLQSGFCQVTRQGMNMDIYFAGFNQMRVELYDLETHYITLYIGKNIYHWQKMHTNGTKFYYADVFDFTNKEKERFPGLLSPFDIEKGAQNPDCRRDVNVSLSLFEVPQNVEFMDYRG